MSAERGIRLLSSHKNQKPWRKCLSLAADQLFARAFAVAKENITSEEERENTTLPRLRLFEKSIVIADYGTRGAWMIPTMVAIINATYSADRALRCWRIY